MADIFTELKRLPQAASEAVKSALGEVSAGWEKSREILETINGVAMTVADFFAWLGLYAMLLVIVTLGVSYLLGIVSPLERRINYLLAVGFGSLVAYWSMFPLDAYGRYMLVMTTPLLFSYAVWLLWIGVKHYWMKRNKKSRPETKEATVSRLLESTSRFQNEGDSRRLRSDLEAILFSLE